MTEGAPTDSPLTPIGFNLVHPPGWEKINLRDESMSDNIMRIVDRAINQLPTDLPKDDVSKLRMDLFKQLKKSASRAARAKAQLLYLPVDRIRGTVVPGSFIVSEPISGGGSGFQSDQVLRGLVADRESSEPVDIDGSSGTRLERIVPPRDDSDVQFASRRVEYVFPVPGHTPPPWLTITFSTVGDGEPDSEFTSALVDLFDAVMTTFRWSYA